MVTSEWQQAKFYSLEIMGHLTQVGWTSGGQARKSEMKIKAWGAGGGGASVSKMVSNQGPDQEMREEL